MGSGGRGGGVEEIPRPSQRRTRKQIVQAKSTRIALTKLNRSHESFKQKLEAAKQVVNEIKPKTSAATGWGGGAVRKSWRRDEGAGRYKENLHFNPARRKLTACILVFDGPNPHGPLHAQIMTQVGRPRKLALSLA